MLTLQKRHKQGVLVETFNLLIITSQKILGWRNMFMLNCTRKV